MKAFIIDDEMHVLEGLKTGISWEALGVREVFAFQRASAALGAYREARPDFVITDITMPGMSGLELIRAIREEDKDTPIIILTGYDDFEFAKEAVHLNVSKYLLKPSVPTEIEFVIHEVVDELTINRKKKQYMEEYLRLEAYRKSSMREQFLMDLIQSGIARRNLVPDKLKLYGLDASILESGRVACIKIVRREDGKISEQDWLLYKFAVDNIAREILNRHDHCHVLRFTDDRLPVIMSGGDPEALKRKAEERLGEVIDKITQYLNLESYAGIGGICRNPTQYAASYRDAVEAVEYLEQEGDQRTISIEDIPNNPLEWPAYPMEEIKAIGETFVRRGGEDLELHWTGIEHYLKRKDVPFCYVQTVCIAVLNQVLQKIIELNKEIMEIKQLGLMISDMQEQRTKDNLIQWTWQQLEQLRNKLKERTTGQRTNSYVEHLIDHVEKFYAEPISFAELARQLHLTRHYLSYLFKKETGVSFRQYLTQYRIEKAKELLLSNEYLVYEVGEKVGYQDPAYFSRIFRQIADMSPIEYAMRGSLD